MIKAIDTPYKNHLFRSRLEARWAFYFDQFNIQWEYEKEGFQLGEDIRYLPDFYLPKFRLYAEVKAKPFTYKEHSKCKLLANATQCNVVELVGLPSVSPMNVIIPSQRYVCPKCGFQEKYDDDNKRIYCECRIKNKVENIINESDAILLFHSEKESYTPLYFTVYQDVYTNDKVIQNAIRKATEARFEFLNT